MTAICPAGHASAADDYCDVCGMPIAAAAAAAPGATPLAPPSTDAPTQAGTPTSQPPDPAGGTQACPSCGGTNALDALFCENCGYDFTTGTMPRPVVAPPDNPPASTAPDEVPAPSTAAPEFTHVAEVWIDPSWYGAQESTDPLPSPGLPVVVPLRGTSLLVGRVSQSRNIHPEVDCASDSGVSRRQCQLTTDGTRWWVEDLESANGTFVGPASGALPTDPIAVGVKRELSADDRVYVGAWTRLVIRPADEQERADLG